MVAGMSDLEKLWAKASPEPIGPWEDISALMDVGVSVRSAITIGALDVAIQNGRWAERFRGDRAIILPVCANGMWPGIDEIIDLVAFRMETPRSFWTYSGDGMVLGRCGMDRASYFGEPLMVHECPLDWLKAGRRGIVVLDWQQYWPLHLSGVPALLCPNEDFEPRLRGNMQRPFPIPPILVPR